jgi:hypothetical protein
MYSDMSPNCSLRPFRAIIFPFAILVLIIRLAIRIKQGLDLHACKKNHNCMSAITQVEVKGYSFVVTSKIHTTSLCESNQQWMLNYNLLDFRYVTG